MVHVEEKSGPIGPEMIAARDSLGLQWERGK